MTDDIIARHRAAHEERGTTIEVYFPPRAPFGVVDDMYDQITDLAHRVKRTGWDPSVSGHRRGFDTDETRSTTLARRISNPEQHEWDQRLADADERLRTQGVRTDYGSPWHAPERRMLLADLLDQHKEDQ